MRRFLAYYGPHKGLFILDLACALVVAAVDVAFPLVTQYILRTLLPAMTADNALVRVFVILICCLVCAYMMRAVLQFVIGYWGHRLGTFIEAESSPISRRCPSPSMTGSARASFFPGSPTTSSK